MGFGLGGLALGSVVTKFIVKYGIFSTFKILAITILIVMVVAASSLRLPRRLQ